MKKLIHLQRRKRGYYKSIDDLQIGDRAVMLSVNLKPTRDFKKHAEGTVVCMSKRKYGQTAVYYELVFKDTVTGEMYKQVSLGIMKCFPADQGKQLMHFKKTRVIHKGKKELKRKRKWKN